VGGSESAIAIAKQDFDATGPGDGEVGFSVAIEIASHHGLRRGRGSDCGKIEG
jgi:hypothetical protein